MFKHRKLVGVGSGILRRVRVNISTIRLGADFRDLIEHRYRRGHLLRNTALNSAAVMLRHHSPNNNAKHTPNRERPANLLITKFSAKRKLGRPPIEVQRAKDFMAGFGELYRSTVAVDQAIAS